MEKNYNATQINDLVEMVDYLKMAKEQLSIIKDGNVILVLGNTGCGKSTMLSSIVYGPDNLELTKDPSNSKLKVIDKKNDGLSGFKIGHNKS